MKRSSIILLVFIFLISSCASAPEINLEPTLGSLYIPAISIGDPVDIIDEYNVFKIPVTAITHVKRNEGGTVVKSKNINGFEAFDAIGIVTVKVKKGFAYVRADNDEPKQILKANDQVIDHIPESLRKLNEYDHEWLVGCFQRGKINQ